MCEVTQPWLLALSGGTLKSIAFLSQKGGSGKTTLAIHIATAAQQSGEHVLLVDTDPQGSAAAWAQARKEETPTVLKASASGLARLLDKAKSEDRTLAVIDTPPHAVPGVDLIARTVDFLVIPCRPSVLDLAAIGSSVQLARASGKPTVFVLNACDPRAPEVEQSRKLLVRHGFPVAPVDVGHRRAFSRALATGSAVTEFDPKGKSAEEINALWKWIHEHMEKK
jgi:chromosome partitioning protein